MGNIFEQFLNTDTDPESGNIFEQFAEDTPSNDELIPSLSKDINTDMYDKFETMEEGQNYYEELIFNEDVALPNGVTAQELVDQG